MSEFPKFGAQSCCGAGRATVVPPVARSWRHASIAGQSAAARVSFQTATPYVRVAAAYTYAPRNSATGWIWLDPVGSRAVQRGNCGDATGPAVAVAGGL